MPGLGEREGETRLVRAMKVRAVPTPRSPVLANLFMLLKHLTLGGSETIGECPGVATPMMGRVIAKRRRKRKHLRLSGPFGWQSAACPGTAFRNTGSLTG
jgi:hypothetical protein